MHRRTALFAVVAAVVALQLTAYAAAADIFKCATPSGKVEFRDRPCDGASGERIEAKDNSSGTGQTLNSIRAQDAALKARLAK